MTTVTLPRDVVVGAILSLCILRDAEYEAYLRLGDPFHFRLSRLDEIDADLRAMEEAADFTPRALLRSIPRHRALVRVEAAHA